MKVYRRPESIPITESPRLALEFLNHRVEALGAGIRRAGHHRGDDAVEVTFDHSSDLLDRLQPRANRPVVPFLPAAPGPAAGSVVPQTHRVGLDPQARAVFRLADFRSSKCAQAVSGHSRPVFRVVRMVNNRASGYRHLDAFSDMIYLAAGDLDLPEQIPDRFRTL